MFWPTLEWVNWCSRQRDKLKQIQVHRKNATCSNHMVQKKWTLTQAQITNEVTEFNWCIFTKLLVGINLIQIKEKLSEKMSLIFETIFKVHHCVFRFISHSTYILWYKDSFLVKQAHFESMFEYEAKGRSTPAITRYRSGFVNPLFWERLRHKVSSWDVQPQLLATAGLPPI